MDQEVKDAPEPEAKKGVSIALQTAPVPVETPEQFEAFLTRQRTLFAEVAFALPDEQFEVFAMLPLSDIQKREMVIKLANERETSRGKAIMPPRSKTRVRRSPDSDKENDPPVDDANIRSSGWLRPGVDDANI